MPWPQRFDLWLTQGLMRNVAAITVEILGWFHLPTVRQGNLICLATGAVGIDEACSGIRSLQAMLMISLFLGDLWRLNVGRRVVVVFASLGLAFVGNVIRTTLLATVAARDGIDAIQSWHDPAGFGVLCFGLVGSWLLGARWRSPASPDVVQVAPPLPVLPAALPIGLILCLLGTELTVGVWFGLRESSAPPNPLVVAWPTRETSFQTVTIPDATRRILLCSDSDAATWRDPAERGWFLYHLRWAPGTTSTQSARLHRPDTCLEASGALLIQDFGRQEVSLPGGSLSFQGYLYQKEGKPLYVLFALHEQSPADRDPAAAILQDWGGWSRLQRAVAGQRNLGQESVEIVMSPSAAKADQDPMAVMRDRLQRLVSIPSMPLPAP